MKTNAGFSLIEVMCAILLLGVGIASLTQGINTALKSSKESEQQTTAVWMASGLVEMLRTKESLETGITTGKEDRTAYAWQQSIQTSAIEGLYDIEIIITEAQTDKAIYILKTKLFLAPNEQIDVKNRNRAKQKPKPGMPPSKP